jgi:predicted enzyme related to lactoylglutathione lyase
MATRLVSVVIDALDMVALGHFWAEALEWAYDDQFLDEGEIDVIANDGSGLELIFGRTDDEKRVKNRIHLDLSGPAGTVQRVSSLGAQPVDIGQGDVPWTVMADPEGNEFCVMENTSGPIGLGSICLDAANPTVMGAFWSAATGWPLEVQADWGVALRAPTGGPSLTMGPPVAPKRGKNRVHLDVAPGVDDDRQLEVERLRSLGARPVDIGQQDVPWVVLADPEDNEFCILTPR